MKWLTLQKNQILHHIQTLNSFYGENLFNLVTSILYVQY